MLRERAKTYLWQLALRNNQGEEEEDVTRLVHRDEGEENRQRCGAALMLLL